MSVNSKNLMEASFKEDIAGGVALVDFMAPWCPDCQEQEPLYEKAAAGLAGKALVGKVNIDDNAALAKVYGVANIPTTILFKDGAEVKRFVGVQQAEVLVDAVGALLP